ncbi:MAG: toprim domain-containing protein [Paracoccaceae bacterium]|nr:toprim domain-containing protein [Paracoccaceae bacterium]
MHSPAADIARRLAEDAEAVCRHYLTNGRKQGRYWIVGDVQNTPGRSLYVRLTGPISGPGAAGKWTDSATGQHGDLLDLIALNMGITTLRDTLDEARRFLSLPRTDRHRAAKPPASRGSPEAARRLWAMGQPMSGTLVERYLAGRGLTGLGHLDSLRFHPSCFYWREDHALTDPPEAWPALLAKVTDLDGQLTGLHRTWLDPATADKAPVIPSRKAMGNLLGHGVRIGKPVSLLAAGEGLETMLSLHLALPNLPVVAALSANHLAALQLPADLRRLYIAVDADPAGLSSADQLTHRAIGAGIDAIYLSPHLGDFNDDLRANGRDELRAHLRQQLTPEDAAMILDLATD